MCSRFRLPRLITNARAPRPCDGDHRRRLAWRVIYHASLNGSWSIPQERTLSFFLVVLRTAAGSTSKPTSEFIFPTYALRTGEIGRLTNHCAAVTTWPEVGSTKSVFQTHNHICHTSRCDGHFSVGEIRNVRVRSVARHILGRGTAGNKFRKCGSWAH